MNCRERACTAALASLPLFVNLLPTLNFQPGLVVPQCSTQSPPEVILSESVDTAFTHIIQPSTVAVVQFLEEEQEWLD